MLVIKVAWISENTFHIFQNPHNIDLLIYNLNQERPQCPVGLSTLAFPGRSRAMHVNDFDRTKQPWVYLTCGHVHGWIDWGECGEDERICPLCRSVSMNML